MRFWVQVKFSTVADHFLVQLFLRIPGVSYGRFMACIVVS